MFDSQLYDWSAITVQVGDTPLVGIQGVRYKSSTEKEYVYGKGNQPLAIKAGNKTFDGEIKLLQNELETMIASAPNGDLAQIKNLIITIAYDNTDQGGGLVIDQLIGVQFTEVEKAMEQAAKFMVTTLPIMFLAVSYDV